MPPSAATLSPEGGGGFRLPPSRAKTPFFDSPSDSPSDRGGDSPSSSSGPFQWKSVESLMSGNVSEEQVQRQIISLHRMVANRDRLALSQLAKGATEVDFRYGK